jgi:phytoene/squalene synthetase
LDGIEAQQHDVFAQRVSVSTTQKALMVARLILPFGS